MQRLFAAENKSLISKYFEVGIYDHHHPARHMTSKLDICKNLSVHFLTTNSYKSRIDYSLA